MSDLFPDRLDRNNAHELNCNGAAIASGPIVTAVPVGQNWQVKVISPDGETTLVGLFGSRLPALGAGVLLAYRVGARVLP